jgi:autotransporter passenger strand-loop-strand repeat protein
VSGSVHGFIIQGGTQEVTGVVFSTILSGGAQVMLSGGSAWDTVVSSGGIVGSGGWNYGSTVIQQNGSASDAIFEFGSLTLSGGSLLGTNTIRNATLSGDSATLTGGNSLVFAPASGSSVVVAGGFSIIGNGSLSHQGPGTLAFNGSAVTASLAVSGAALTGSGTVGSLDFAGGASFAPVLDIASPSGGVFTVSGAVTGLAGATLAPAWRAAPLSAGQSVSFLILDAASLDNSAGFGTPDDLVMATYSQSASAGGLGSRLYLNAVGRATSLQTNYGYAMTPNAFNAAGVLDNADALGLLPDLMDAIRLLPADAAGVAGAVNQLHPEAAATAQLTGVQAVRLFDLNIPTIRGLDVQLGGAAAAASADALGSITFSRPNAFTLFAMPFGSWAERKSGDRYSGYSLDLGGFALGGLRTLGNFQYGFAAGYSRQRLEMKEFSARNDADLLHLVLFAGWKPGNLFVDASIGYSRAWNDSERKIAFPGYTAKNAGKFGQDFWSGRLALGYIFELPAGVNLIPGIGLDHVHARARGYRESGSPAAAAVAANSYQSLELPVSLNLEKTFRTSSGAIIIPRVGAAWIPELADRNAATGASFVQAPAAGRFEARSLSPGRNRGQLSAGVRARLNGRTTLGVDYSFDFAEKYANHNLGASIGIDF